MKRNIFRLFLLGVMTLFTLGAWAQTPDKDYLCFTANSASSTVTLNRTGSPAAVTIQYSTDKGANWYEYSFGSTITLSASGDKVYFRNAADAVTNFSTSTSDYYRFSMSGSIDASGNVMSLVDRNVNSTTIPCDYCFHRLFVNCSELTSAPSLPATTLASSCYSGMFDSCTNLWYAPALPATTLASNCYEKMFCECSALTIAPAELPATTMASSCCTGMFQNCTKLTTAPKLPATKLANNCYEEMFIDCSALTSAPELPATKLASGCYMQMFNGCKKLNYVEVGFTAWGNDGNTSDWLKGVANNGTFVCSTELAVTTRDASHVPTEWTIKMFKKDITFYDSTPYTATANTECENLTYSRTFNNTNWQPLYVPFAISYDEWKNDFEVAAINNFHEYTNENGETVKTELEVRLVKSGTLKPNHPYLIRAKSADASAAQEIDISSRKLYTSEENSIDCSSVERKYTFTGTYKEITGMETKEYIFLSNGKLCMAENDYVALSPQRWYLKIESRGSQVGDNNYAGAKEMQFDIMLLDDETTGIDEITVTRTPLKNSSKAVYNLNGIRVNEGYKGIVIKNGKKVYQK